MYLHRCLMLAILFAALIVSPAAADWPQFRGVNAAGHAEDHPSLPLDFGPEKNLLWKCSLPRGLSSPCVSGDSVFLTSFDTETATFHLHCVSTSDGTVTWTTPIHADAIEKVHKSSSPANATAVADAQRVCVYFASCGVFCFDRKGTPLWNHKLPTSKRFNGSGTSPILVDGKLILNREDDREKYLIALDASTGKTSWKTVHGGGGGSFGEATPVLWNDQLILHRHYEVAAFDLETGSRLWSLPLKTTAASTPVIQDDVLYVAAWNNFGEADLVGSLPPFERMLKTHDKDADGKLSRAETPWGPSVARRPELDGRKLGGNMPVKFMFGSLDRNRDGNLDENEWNAIPELAESMIENAKHGMAAIKLPAQRSGPATVLWELNKSVPEVPSPLVHGDRVYMIKNGGILTCIDKQSGESVYRKRLKATGPYLASPILVNDHLITASGDGVVSVFKTGDSFELVSSTDLGSPIFSTPAASGGTLYVRTDEALYAFRK